jgi:hypothetical protein
MSGAGGQFNRAAMINLIRPFPGQRWLEKHGSTYTDLNRVLKKTKQASGFVEISG